MPKVVTRDTARTGEMQRIITEQDVIEGVSHALACKELDDRALALDTLANGCLKDN